MTAVELEFIEHLRMRLPPHPALRLGVGDDAAVVACGDDVVVAADMLVEGRHFRLAEATARQVGRKALAVNLSDFAAMAARPIAAVVSLAVSEQGALDAAVGVLEGMLPLAEEFEVAIAGGDTNVWDGPLVVNVTLMGAPGPQGLWRRDGAEVGDALLATGSFGGSLLGRHLDFTPLVREAAAVAERCAVHAALDVSDGLSLDAGRLAAASGCGIVLDLDAIPVARAARELSHRSADGQSALDHALCDGEDFQLLLAVERAAAEELVAAPPAGLQLAQIGEVIAEEGLFARDGAGRRPLPPRGYEHGGSQSA